MPNLKNHIAGPILIYSLCEIQTDTQIGCIPRCARFIKNSVKMIEKHEIRCLHSHEQQKLFIMWILGRGPGCAVWRISWLLVRWCWWSKWNEGLFNPLAVVVFASGSI
jgi:hypothetical protein